MVSTARPYPFDWLTKYSRGDARRASSVARACSPSRAPSRVRALLDENWKALLGGTVEAWPEIPAAANLGEWLATKWGDAWAVVADHAVFGLCAWVTDGEFAAALADRALDVASSSASFGLDAYGGASAARDLSAARETALALMAARAGRWACAPSPPPRVRGVTAKADDVAAALGCERVVAWPWKFAVGLMAANAVLLVAEERLARAGTSVAPWDIEWIESMRDGHVGFDVVLASDRLPGVELLRLAQGDVLLLEGPVALGADDAIEGDVCLVAGSVEVPLRWTTERVTLAAAPRKRVRAVSEAKGSEHDTAPLGDGAMRTQLVSELPMDVDVVIARAAFTLGEISAWRVGEVIAMPTRIGSRVEVRAGGRAVAQGELVDVDGEVGVRVTELL